VIPVPFGWETCEIGQVTDVVGGATPASKDPLNFSDVDGIPWITPADLSGYKSMYIVRGKRNLTEKGFAESSTAMIPTGSILFSSRAPVGYVAIAANAVCTNQGFKSFVLPHGLESRFVYQYIKHIKPLAEQRATGTTFKELSGRAAAQLPLLIAPFNEQKRIADKLDTVLSKVDACRERLDRIPNILKRFRQAVLAAAASGDLTKDWRSENPKDAIASLLAQRVHAEHQSAGGHKAGNAAPPTEDVHDLLPEMFPAAWELVTLRDLVAPDRPITYGILKPGPDIENGVRYIRVADFPNEQLNLRGIRRTSHEMDNAFKRSRLKSGDLLMSIRGTVGRVISIPSELEGANITQDSARLSIQSAMNSDFVLWFLRSEMAQVRMRGAVKGVAVRGINIGDVRALQVPLPSRGEQDEIVRRVRTLLGYAERLEANFNAARSQVDRLTPALLAKAFRGELVPQDPSDEPASELLERIRSSRALQPKRYRLIHGLSSPVKRPPRLEVKVLTRKEVQDKPHLSAILKERGPLTAEALWKASELGEIDDFYDQLKEEEERGLLRERQDKKGGSPRILEAA
jgi:type I restriction enzyme S subunit